MSEHRHGPGCDCPDCKKVRALEKKLDAVLERSDAAPRDKAYSLILLAIAELLDDHGIAGGKREFMIMVKRRFAEIDAAGLEESLH
jgi:hypothetical protein